MGYAVQLYFNKELEGEFLDVRTALGKVGVTPTLERLGDRPHVSLAVLSEVQVSHCISMIEQISKSQRPLAVDFSAFGAFPTTQGVVYLSPTPSQALLRLHETIYRHLKDIGGLVHEYYLPSSWVPHSTIGFELSAHEVGVALSWLHGNFKPTAGTFSSIGVIEFLPIKELATFELARKIARSNVSSSGRVASGTGRRRST
jgi:2'-5' RNA ligase